MLNAYLPSLFQIWTKLVINWMHNGGGGFGTNFNLAHLGIFHNIFGSNWQSGLRRED